MNPGPWNPDWGYTFIREGKKLLGILAMCPYCGHQWTYRGGDKHTATCHGKVKEDDYDYICGHKVRLHPYLLKLKEKSPDRSKQYNWGRTSRSELRYPNRNYDHISKVRR